uniref:Uncharacterized protein n=1 Tax=Macaca fascicularis TaxID=9541 RepID=A0A7N9DF90_MACFA
MREGLAIANLTGLSDLSSCFMCAALGQPPLTAVPLSGPPSNQIVGPQNLHLSLMSSYIVVPAKKSFPIAIQLATLAFVITPPFFLAPRYMLHLAYSSGAMVPCLKTSVQPQDGGWICLPVTLVPRLTLLTPAEFLGWTGTTSEETPRYERAVFLPLVAGISLTTSLIAAGLAGGALGHTVVESSKLFQQFSVAMEASAESLASLQRQLTSLAQVSLQNRRALDLLTAEKGGTCMFLKEECCFYINESGLVESRVQQLHKLSLEMKKQQFASAANSWWNSSMLSLLAPFIGPLVTLLLLLTIGPCIVNKILTFVRERFDTIQLMVLRTQYQPLDPLEEIEMTP